MANADGYVTPKPGVPKTLGILNIIFGVLLVLMGLCQVGGLLIAPTAMNLAEKTVKDAQSKLEARDKENLKSLDDREAAAKTDEEKKAIQQERANAIASKPQMPTMDMSAATEVLHDPTIMGFTYVNLAIGLILHIMLIVSGIGLIRFTPWGRSLAVAWGGLQLLALVVMTTASLMIVQPINKAATEKQIAKFEEAAKNKGANSVEASQAQMMKMMVPLQLPMIVGGAVVGMIYPVIVLILLNTAGARAACLPKKSDEMEGY